MLVYTNTFENIKTKGINFPVEDQYYANDNEAIVADGFRGQSYGEQKLGLLLQKHVFTEKTTNYKVDNSTFFLL